MKGDVDLSIYCSPAREGEKRKEEISRRGPSRNYGPMNLDPPPPSFVMMMRRNV
jgi:hypothetical protein